MYKQNDIIVFKISNTVKTGLIVSNNNFLQNYDNTVLVFPLISKEKSDKLSYKLLATSLQEGRLIKEAYVDCHHPQAISKDIILKKVASLRQNQTTEIINRFVGLIKQAA